MTLLKLSIKNYKNLEENMKDKIKNKEYLQADIKGRDGEAPDGK